ncbi:MAG: very short patch repair endonuclease [Candidatus Nanopelagicales bacterium]|nr:very short patch repair endonuclease [Candidatus Nanopelagicales bacterium]
MIQPKHRDPAVTRKIMASVRSKDSKAELLLRRELHRRGLRYRLHDKRLPGRPDLVFGPAKLVVFVDGDFWHGAGWQERGFMSFEAQFARFKEPEKWRAKIERNLARDESVTEQLLASGWRVIRIWESQILKDVRPAADRVVAALIEADECSLAEGH